MVTTTHHEHVIVKHVWPMNKRLLAIEVVQLPEDNHMFLDSGAILDTSNPAEPRKPQAMPRTWRSRVRTLPQSDFGAKAEVKDPEIPVILV